LTKHLLQHLVVVRIDALRHASGMLQHVEPALQRPGATGRASSGVRKMTMALARAGGIRYPESGQAE